MRSGRVNRWLLVAFFASLLLVGIDCSKDDTSKPVVDRTPPMIASVTGIDLHHVDIVFSEKLLESSAETAANYGITRQGGPEVIDILSVVLMADGKTVSLETSSQSSVTYILAVTAVKDLAGNAMGTQTTQFDGNSSLDTTPPVVASTVPTNGEHGVDTTATVVVEFSEKMNRVSVESNFHLEREFGGNVSGTFAWEANDTRCIFTPGSHLQYGVKYNASVNTGATDVAGNHLGSAYVWSFVTGSTGAISGSISYTGMPPYNRVLIGVFKDACLREQIASGEIETPGNYTIDPVPSGTCYIGAYMDLNNSNEPDIGEPAGIYDVNSDDQPDPITVSVNRTRTGINFTLNRQFQLSTISGTVSKNPDVTQSDTTYVAFFTSDPSQGGGDPVDIQVLPSGVGAYASSPLPLGCYYVFCYMDTNHNQQLDFLNDVPVEPVGLHGQVVQGQPEFIPIFLLTNTTGVNLTLFYFPSGPAPFPGLLHLRDVSFSKAGAVRTTF